MAVRTRKLKNSQIPTKRSVNLIQEEKKARKWAIAVPSIALIILASMLLSKVAVADRLKALSGIRSENAAIQARINDYEARINDYANVQEEYYRYTFTGMNAEEQNRVDRMDIVSLLNKYVRTVSDIDSWKVYGNVLNITMSDISLAQANNIVAALETDELVEFCTLTTATTDNGYDDNMIKANMTVYLNGPVDLGGKNG